MAAQDFINQIGPIIQKNAAQRGYKVCSATIAQACLESRYGASELSAKYYNYFGMKCGSSWTGKSVNMKTKEEYTTGTLTTISDNFRAYNSMEEGVAGYYDFIDAVRYANLRTAETGAQYAQMIKDDGWATDSSYVSKLLKIMTDYSLTTYDTGTVQQATASSDVTSSQSQASYLVTPDDAAAARQGHSPSPDVLDALTHSKSVTVTNSDNLRTAYPASLTATLTGASSCYVLNDSTVVDIGKVRGKYVVSTRVNAYEIVRYRNLKSVGVKINQKLSKGAYVGKASKNTLLLEYATSWRGNSNLCVRISNKTYFKQNPIDILDGTYILQNSTTSAFYPSRATDYISYTEAEAEEFGKSKADD